MKETAKQKKYNASQVAYLNAIVKTTLAPSPIHGVGLTALRDMQQGEKLYADIAPAIFQLSMKEMALLRPEIKTLLLGQWPQIVNGSGFAYPTTKLQAFCNHSDTPNYDAVNDVLLADIREGEEITEDYRKIPGYEQVFPWLNEKV